MSDRMTNLADYWRNAIKNNPRLSGKVRILFSDDDPERITFGVFDTDGGRGWAWTVQSNADFSEVIPVLADYAEQALSLQRSPPVTIAGCKSNPVWMSIDRHD